MHWGVTATDQTKADLQTLCRIVKRISENAGPTEKTEFEESEFLNDEVRPKLERHMRYQTLIEDGEGKKQKGYKYGREAAHDLFFATIGNDDWQPSKDNINTVKALHQFEWLLEKAQQTALDETCEKVSGEVVNELKFTSTLLML